jgi:phage terminase large subunit
MEILIPNEFKGLFNNDWREAGVYGGRYSLKSHTVARYLIIKAREKKTRVACFRELQNSIADSSHQLLADLINKYELRDFEITQNAIINKLNGSDFIFKGLYHNEQSIKSIEGIDIAWVEEAQTVSNKSLEVLTPTIRKTGSRIIYTYNRLLEEDPVHKRLVLEGRPDTLIINENYDIAIKYGWMPDEILKEIEDDKKNRPSLYKHKWLGEPVHQERRIYNDWNIIDSIPHEARLERYGLDFGYSNDPTSIVAIYYYNGGYILDEIAHLKGLSNKQIADILKGQENNALVVADSAEPKSIDEIRSYGVNITGAKKKAEGSTDSYVKWSIGIVQEQRISITKRSLNVIKGYKNYLWQVDKEDKILNTPDHSFSDSMDAVRYGLVSLVNNIRPKRIPTKQPRRGVGIHGV